MTHDPDATSALPAVPTTPTPPMGVPTFAPPPGPAAPVAPRTGFRPGRRLWAFAVAGLLVVLVVLVVADRAAAVILSGRASARLACLAGASSNPAVRVTGFPVLPALAAGKLPRIEARTDRWTVAGAGTVTDVTVTADGVAIPGKDRVLRIDSLEGSFTVPYSYLPATTNGTAMTYAGGPNGMIAITATFALGGVGLPVALMAKPVIESGRVTIEPVEVQAFGIRQSAAAFKEQIAGYVPRKSLPDLPSGLRFSSVTATSGGLQFGITGTSVELPPTADGQVGVATARCG